MNADYERAKAYALGRLASELSPKLTYHSLRHTRDDVLPAAVRLAQAADVNGEALLCLTTAALFHDIGFLCNYDEHERGSIAIARAALPHCGYTPEQIETIAGLIAATKMPQRPQTPLEQLLWDADLDLLGSDDFWELNRLGPQFGGIANKAQRLIAPLGDYAVSHYFIYDPGIGRIDPALFYPPWRSATESILAAPTPFPRPRQMP